ncbi:phage tail tube protein [Lichenihabitans psoromatis]|uniref:phage tail tube protein n=1 Tax=Lichenihabitans psoromatis TaxID=2528642 RepID=UPI00103842BB|nr:phage tail tube protein [Lichenihabitans psoromatis]
MAIPKTLPFSAFQVLIGDGATPEAFVSPCGFMQRSLEFKATATESMVPDCDDEDAPSWPVRDISSISATVSGQGFMSVGAAALWREWKMTGGKRNVRVGPANQTLANGGGYYSGVAVVTSWKGDVTKGERVKLNVQIDSDGPWVWVAATA